MACILKFCELHYDWAFTSESSFCSVVWLSWCTSYRLIFWFRLFLKTPVTCMWDIWWPIGLTAKASLIFVIYLLFKQNFNIASFYMVLNMFNTLRKKGIFLVVTTHWKQCYFTSKENELTQTLNIGKVLVDVFIQIIH